MSRQLLLPGTGRFHQGTLCSEEEGEVGWPLPPACACALSGCTASCVAPCMLRAIPLLPLLLLLRLLALVLLPGSRRAAGSSSSTTQGAPRAREGGLARGAAGGAGRRACTGWCCSSCACAGCCRSCMVADGGNSVSCPLLAARGVAPEESGGGLEVSLHGASPAGGQRGRRRQQDTRLAVRAVQHTTAPPPPSPTPPPPQPQPPPRRAAARARPTRRRTSWPALARWTAGCPCPWAAR